MSCSTARQHTVGGQSQGVLLGTWGDGINYSFLMIIFLSFILSLTEQQICLKAYLSTFAYLKKNKPLSTIYINYHMILCDTKKSRRQSPVALYITKAISCILVFKKKSLKSKFTSVIHRIPTLTHLMGNWTFDYVSGIRHFDVQIGQMFVLPACWSMTEATSTQLLDRPTTVRVTAA